MKEAYYFSHDSNARRDPKIIAMRCVYGAQGYGWYWILIEMLRESEGYKINMQSKYAYNAIAYELGCECNTAEQFLHDCIYEFDLFQVEGPYFHSESLLRRMKMREEKSEKARQSALQRWKKTQNHADDMRTHSEVNADGMQGKESKRKGKENIYTTEFESFWDTYPRKKEKPKAFKCWNARLKEGESPEKLLVCASNYANEVMKKGTEEQYIKLPATFLGPSKPYEDYKKLTVVAKSKPFNKFDYDVALQRHIENGGDPSEFAY